MSDAFERALAFTLRWEGGTSDHEDDPGGLTRFGISSRAHPDVAVATLTESQAREIYRREYWTAAKCNELPERTSVAMFDRAVNQGPKAATKMLQRCLGVKEDGVLGPKTLFAAWQANDQKLALCLVVEAGRLVARLANRDHTQRVFLEGWVARLVDLAAEVARG